MTQESDNDQVRDADELGVHVSALEHPMVLAALARMASSGAWQRVIDERPLSEGIDVADAEFLVAAGAVTRVGDDTFRLVLSEPMYRDPEAVANSALYLLRWRFRTLWARPLGGPTKILRRSSRSVG